jgi:hypothetical protein
MKMFTKIKKFLLVRESADNYIYTPYQNHTVFLFDSIGKYGTIEKAIIYTEIEKNLYNLAIANLNDEYLDDKTETNNGDFIKIFATIYQSILSFITFNQSATVLIDGNTKQKKNVYCKLVSKYYDMLTVNFKIGASLNDIIVPFVKDMIYDKIYLKLKTTNMNEKNKHKLNIIDHGDIILPDKILKELAIKKAKDLEWFKSMEKYTENGVLLTAEEYNKRKTTQ